LYATLLWLKLPGSLAIGALTSMLGAAGVTASACIYLVPARPAWNSKRTVGGFFLTGMLLGPLLAASLGIGERRWLNIAIVVAAAGHLLNKAGKFFWLTASDSFELQASARLLSTTLASSFLGSGVLLCLGGIILPLFVPTWAGACASLFIAFAGEVLGRYVFFVSVVPKNMAASYLSAVKAAA
jgi:DMSO reductase anchor subunit